jgi:tetraacyldisaccharide 4'-kinase
VRRPWQSGRREARCLRLALAPLVPLSWLYGSGARVHRRLFRMGVLPETRLPCRVLSVGSLVVGGAAKTPTAAWVAAQLRARGYEVVLASRGYGGRPRDRVQVVSDGRFVRRRVAEAGDEPLVLAARAPGVPVLVGRDRTQLGWRALSLFGADVLVLDDGFQHHRLHRDLDLVTLDAAFGLGNGWLLPRGPLREPLDSIRYADAIGVVDGALDPLDEAVLARWCPGARRFTARRRPLLLRPLEGGPGEAPDVLRGADVGVLAGLAQPASLRRTVESLGARVVAERLFPDHHRYRERDLEGLARETPRWITSEKDALKIAPHHVGAADVRVLVIGLEVEGAAELLDWIETRLR